MGLVACETHGCGFITFVCPHIVKAVLAASRCPGIELLVYSAKDDPDLEGIKDSCWFCPECIKEHTLPPTGTAITSVDLDPFLERTGALYRPMCPGCFQAWRDSGMG